jgi:hypothetical protein
VSAEFTETFTIAINILNTIRYIWAANCFLLHVKPVIIKLPNVLYCTVFSTFMTMLKVIVHAADITQVQPLSKICCDNKIIIIIIQFSFITVLVELLLLLLLLPPPPVIIIIIIIIIIRARWVWER